jgi:hypothetical protein
MRFETQLIARVMCDASHLCWNNGAAASALSSEIISTPIKKRDYGGKFVESEADGS